MAHGAQTLMFDNEACLPASQSEQETRPSAAVTVPAEHSEHADAPGEEANAPGQHLVHVTVPLDDAKVPTGQKGQSARPCESA